MLVLKHICLYAPLKKSTNISGAASHRHRILIYFYAFLLPFGCRRCRLEWQEEMEMELELKLVLVLVLELEQWLFGAAGRQVMCNL